MKISLDLLPEGRKNDLKRTKLFRKVIWFEIVFLFPIFVMSAILLDNLYVLNYEKGASAKIYALELGQDQYKKLNDFQGSFKQANDLSTLALNFQGKHLQWTNVLHELSATMPDSVTLKDVASNDFQLSFTGMAKTRDDLLNFQSALEKSACFQNVNVPLSDMVQKNDLNFQIDLSVKPDCLMKKI